MKNTQWVRLLAYVTGMVNQRLLLLQNEYLAGCDSPIPNGPRWPKLANDLDEELCKRGCMRSPTGYVPSLAPEVDCCKFDGPKFRQYPGSRAVRREVIELVLWICSEMPKTLTQSHQAASRRTVSAKQPLFFRFGIPAL